MGNAQWAFYPQSGWKEELLVWLKMEHTDDDNWGGGGGVTQCYEVLGLENYRIAERWRWSGNGGVNSGKQVGIGGRVP